MLKPLVRYAAPLVTLEEILSIDASEITTHMSVAPGKSCFEGHYPDCPIYPGVFIVEGVQQAARYHAEVYRRQLQLVEVCSVRFFAAVRPGDLLQSTCRFQRESNSRTVEMQATCFNQKTKVAEVKMKFTCSDDA